MVSAPNIRKVIVSTPGSIFLIDDVSFNIVPATGPPTIAAHPVGRYVRQGTNVTLTATAYGQAPIVYQWRKDGTNITSGARITGANTPVLAIANALESDSGVYSVFVANSLGSATSSNATLLVSALDHFAWSGIASPQFANAPFAATLRAEDASNQIVSNFNGVVTLTGRTGVLNTTNSILPAAGHTQIGSGNFTLGYSFIPNTNITVTHVRHYFGSKVSIWTDTGTLLASQNVSSTPGTWMETALSTPLVLSAGQQYRVAAYSAGGQYLWRNDMDTSFPHGGINFGVEISGDNFPSNTDSIRWWFVDLRYTVGTSVTVPLTPTAANFVGGLWTGNLRVGQRATDLVLRADDLQGDFGVSNPFNVVGEPRLQVQVSGDILLVVWPLEAAGLMLETSPTLDSNTWTRVLEPPHRIGDQYVLPIYMDRPGGFYRLRRP
jgi:hypothetical protein